MKMRRIDARRLSRTCLALILALALPLALAEGDGTVEEPSVVEEAAPEPEPVSAPASEPEPVSEPVSEPASEPEPVPELVSEPVSEPVSQAEPVQESAATQESAQPVSPDTDESSQDSASGGEIPVEEPQFAETDGANETPAQPAGDEPAADGASSEAGEVDESTPEAAEDAPVQEAAESAGDVQETAPEFSDPIMPAENSSPQAETTPEPTAEPAQEEAPGLLPEPTPEPTAEPLLEQAPGPSVEPLAEATPEPTPEPAPEPAEAPVGALTLVIADHVGLSLAGDSYQVDPAQVSALTLAWSYDGVCDGYHAFITGSMGDVVFNGTLYEPALTLSLTGLASDSYVATVQVMLGEALLCEASLSFALVQPQQQEAEEAQPDEEETPTSEGDSPAPGEAFPGVGFSRGSVRGSSRGGSRSVSGVSGEAEAQSPLVTAGEALTASHSPGSKDMRLYGSVDLALDGGPMTVLTLGDSTLEIYPDSGTFTASLEGDVLILIPEAVIEGWTVDGAALRTLELSGVSALRLGLNGKTVELSTCPELTGSVYGQLRAEGFTRKDFDYTVASGVATVSVGGETYLLSEGGELTAAEER